jgi:hypothetical protein
MLAAIGVQLSVPYYYASPGELESRTVADINDPEERVYYTQPTKSPVPFPYHQGWSVKQLAANMDGVQESPVYGLRRVLDGLKVPHTAVEVMPTNEEIIGALKGIFG